MVFFCVSELLFLKHILLLCTEFIFSLYLVGKILFGLGFQISYPLALPPFGQLPRELLSLPLHSESAIHVLGWFSPYHIDDSRVALYLSCSAYLALLMKSTALGIWGIPRKYISKSSRA